MSSLLFFLRTCCSKSHPRIHLLKRLRGKKEKKKEIKKEEEKEEEENKKNKIPKSGRTQESERRAPPLDLKIVEVGESAADPVEHGEPGLGVGRQRGRCPWRELVRAQRAANAVGSRTGALPGREKAEILAEAERRGGQAGHGRLLVTVVAEETRHRVGGRLAEAGRR